MVKYYPSHGSEGVIAFDGMGPFDFDHGPFVIETRPSPRHPGTRDLVKITPSKGAVELPLRRGVKLFEFYAETARDCLIFTPELLDDLADSIENIREFYLEFRGKPHEYITANLKCWDLFSEQTDFQHSAFDVYENSAFYIN